VPIGHRGDTRSRRQSIAGALILGLLLGVVGRPAGAAATGGEPSAPDPVFDEVADDEALPGFPDPFEPVNRVTFAINRKIDDWLLEPVMRAYRFVVPAPARRAVRRALLNLDSPVTFVNDILQLEPGDAAVTVARFVVNTTVGVVGLFDVAGEFADLRGHESDFGQTLALSGLPSGPYLVLPFLGPTNVRDGTGYAVDFLFRPTTYLLTPGGAVFITGLIQPGQEFLVTTLLESSTEIAEGLTTREAAGPGLDALEASSLDYYAALRNAYYQSRTALIWRRGPEHGPLARARTVLAALSLRPSRGEVGDLRPKRRDQGVEALALEH
jgi:phospholipid-binding lipoprotein MlaA